ncbi:hypothetical protein Vretimale_266 [Volvox reticuliferus]|uniref:Uncharacterized protein n=1 Tax=Volvox reticuliferus TaxID=1737510 RepID=A0A8J4D6S1_9CHLO|nr:hypothetical protein Vretifemale_8184 [Volvox reticuliferus]GIL93985.1 hypothetical protein Vretimale_266 [Volvox reticuliferus]
MSQPTRNHIPSAYSVAGAFPTPQRRCPLTLRQRQVTTLFTKIQIKCAAAGGAAPGESSPDGTTTHAALPPPNPNSSSTTATTTTTTSYQKDPTSPSLEDDLATLCSRITSLFPLWVVLAAAVALWRPELFTWLPTRFITWGLALTMLGMGLTMRLSDFGDVFRRMPLLLLLGMLLQYTVMPGLGWLFSRYAGLPAPLAVGIAVLSACPGGTASNIVAFLARGEMALSILMTAASTLAAVVATPTITAALAGTLVPVDAKGLFVSTLQVVLLPVMLGCLANQRFPAAVSRIARYTPAVATLLVAAIVGSTLAASAGAVRASGPALLGAVAGLHASGFFLGYVISKALGLSDKICRTMSIEVGMQNSTLGAVLAALHFADPLTAAPCAVSACTHSIMGSALAAFWQRTTAAEAEMQVQAVKNTEASDRRQSE